MAHEDSREARAPEDLDGQRAELCKRLKIPYRARSYIKALFSKYPNIYDVVDSSFYCNPDYACRLARYEIYKIASKNRRDKH